MAKAKGSTDPNAPVTPMPPAGTAPDPIAPLGTDPTATDPNAPVDPADSVDPGLGSEASSDPLPARDLDGDGVAETPGAEAPGQPSINLGHPTTPAADPNQPTAQNAAHVPPGGRGTTPGQPEPGQEPRKVETPPVVPPGDQGDLYPSNKSRR